MSAKENLKIGLLLDSFDVAAWEYDVIERLGKLREAVIELVIVTGETAEGQRPGSNAAACKSIVYRLHCLVDEKLTAAHEPSAFDKKNLHELLADIETLRIAPAGKTKEQRYNKAAINTIGKHHLDIIVYMGARNIEDNFAGIPKYGVWTYEHGNERQNTGLPLGYGEVVAGLDEISAVLKIKQQDGGERILHRSVLSTDAMSIFNTNNICGWKSTPLLPRKVQELSVHGAEAFFSGVDKLNSTLGFHNRRTYGIPNNIEALKHALKRMWRAGLSEYERKLYLDQWCIFFKFSNEINDDWSSYQRLIPGKERFWADPFLVYHEGKYYIFVEELLYTTAMKGFISVIEVDRSGKYRLPVKVLEKEYRMSYPFVFLHEGKYFMIPETEENSSIEVYECMEFPYHWRHMMNLMEEVRAVDTTLHFHNGKWWLFTAMDASGTSSFNDELYLFYADTPFTTQWTSHPGNPVISDVKKSRPAGRIFSYRGKTYRPSQDCAGLYGKAIKFNEIKELTEYSYVEAQVAAIEPGWDSNILGAHTFAHENGLTVMDCILRRNRLLLKWKRFMSSGKRTPDSTEQQLRKEQAI